MEPTLPDILSTIFKYGVVTGFYIAILGLNYGMFAFLHPSKNQDKTARPNGHLILAALILPLPISVLAAKLLALPFTNAGTPVLIIAVAAGALFASFSLLTYLDPIRNGTRFNQQRTPHNAVFFGVIGITIMGACFIFRKMLAF